MVWSREHGDDGFRGQKMRSMCQFDARTVSYLPEAVWKHIWREGHAGTSERKSVLRDIPGMMIAIKSKDLEI